MTEYVSVDVSEFQRPVNDTYPHKWFSFRVCDGSYIDKNVGLNLSWALHARTTGRIDGFTVYVVYRPFKNSIILQTLDRLGIPTDCVVMIDAETWGGQITGDHSVELNQLATALATRQGSQQRVWAYGNRGDLATLWPNRPSWLGVVVASYGGTKPSLPGQVGWQYTDGQYSVPGLPSSSAPFGPCDHNVFTISAPEGDWFAMATQADLQKAVRAELEYVMPRVIALARSGQANAVFNARNSGSLIDGKGIDGLIASEQSAAVDMDALAEAVAAKLYAKVVAAGSGTPT